MGRLKLFDNNGDAADEDLSKIEINHEFAKRYEHNKKREELQRYEELKKSGRLSDSDSEDTSFSDEEILAEPSKKMDLEFLDALIKVKNQDPVLKNKDAKLFNSDSESDSENESDGDNEKVNGGGDDAKKRKKPMYLKDVVWKHLNEAGPDFDDDDDNEEMGSRNNGSANKVKSYSEEQEELRRDFLKVVEGDGNEEEGDFFRVKKDENKEEDEEEEREIGNKLNEYFGEDEKLDEDTMFLKDYFRNRMWLDDEKNNNTGGKEIEFSEDEEEIERQEDYEREFNFRYEENAGDRVMGHSRKVVESVRKKDNTRKLRRERKEERMAQAEFERKEELKHLKNLKKKEIDEKLQKIREVAGIGEGGRNLLDEDYLEEEFDPEEYDMKMKEAFDEEYYKAEDVDPEFGSDGDEDGSGFEKPDFDKEDEFLGLPKSCDQLKESGEGFVSVRQRILKSWVEDGDGDGDENELVEDQDDEAKRKRKQKPSEVEKAVREQLMEEYYKLDFEDTVGDLKTRFKYKPVNAKRYGLSPAQILMMDEKELNQYVSVKKLAPYREKEWKVPRMKAVQLKQMNRKLLHGETSDCSKDKKKIRHSGPETTKVLSEIEYERSQPEELNDASNISRSSKRKRRQAEVKPSRFRLMAYGKTPTKSKSKMQQ